jgi:hypothetical protein
MAMQNLQLTCSAHNKGLLLYFGVVLECDSCILEALFFSWMSHWEVRGVSRETFLNSVSARMLAPLIVYFNLPSRVNALNYNRWSFHSGDLQQSPPDHLNSTGVAFICLPRKRHLECLYFHVDDNGVVKYFNNEKKLRVLRTENIDALIDAHIKTIVNLVHTPTFEQELAELDKLSKT